MDDTEKGQQNGPVLFFDDHCLFCVRFKEALARMDLQKKIIFIPLSDESWQLRFPHISKEEAQSTVHLLDEQGGLYRGSEVIVYLANFFPKVSSLAWLLETEAGKKATDLFYEGLNHLRILLTDKEKNPCPQCDSKDKNK